MSYIRVKRRFWRLELLYIFLRGWQTRVAAAGPANLVDGLRLCRGLPSVAYGDSSPQRGEPEKHLLRDVELELGVLPVFFVLPCRGYSIASQGCIAIKRFHKLAYRWQIRKADRRHLAYVWQFIPERPQLEGTQFPPNRSVTKTSCHI